MTEHDELHVLARQVADNLIDPDKKQLRFNEIVETAKRFYNNPEDGVRELVVSCDKARSDLYVKGRPMWQVLAVEYGWMIGEAERIAA